VIPAGTSSPDFTKAVATAGTATGQLTTQSSQVSVSQAVADWGAVASAVADQYRQAIIDNKDNPQNQAAAIAALNKEFGSYFQGHQGETTVKIATTFDPKTGATTVRTEDELSNGAVTTQTTFPNGTAVTTATTGAGHTVTVVTEADGSKTALAPGQDPTPKGTQPIIADMTAGKSIGLIAQERGLTYDQVVAQLQAAGFDVQTTTPMTENGVATVEIRDRATGRTVTEYEHPNSGNYSITVTDASGNQTTSPARDSQGRKVTTTYDPTTGGTTMTHVNDLGDGSVVQETDLPSGVTVVTTTDKSGHSQTVVTDANGKQTTLAASQVPSRQGAQPIVQDIATGKSVDQIAAEHGWTRDQVLTQLAAAGLALKTSSGNGVNSTSVVDQHGGQAIATHSTQADGSQTTEYTDADGNHHVVRTTPFIGPVVGPRPTTSTETVTEPNGRTTQTTTAMDGKKTVAVTFNGYTLTTAPDGSKTLTDQATGNTITIKAGSADDALAQLLTSVDPHSSDPAKAKEGQVIVSTVGGIFAGEELPGATQAASDADANLKAIIAKYGAPTQAQDSKNHIVDPMGKPPPGKAPSGGAWAPVEINGTWYWADPEVAKAVIADDIAQTQLAQVQGVAGQRQAQVDVYALDPSYKGATSDARSVINQALAPLNLVLKPTKPDGTLQQAQDRLTAANAYLTNVGDALGSYQAAASLLDTAIAQNNGLKPVFDPNVPAFTNPGTNRQADYYQAVAAHAQVQSLFSQIGLDTSQGDLSTVNAMVALSGTADAPAGVLPAGGQPVPITVGGQTIEVAPDVAAKYQQKPVIGTLTDKGVTAVAIEVDVTNPDGTTSKQWRWMDPQLALQKINADSTVGLAGAYNDYFAAHSRFTSLDVQSQALQQQLVSNYFSQRPDLLQPGATFSSVDGSKYYGKFESDTVQVRADGQVWLVLQFEHGTNDIQLTFSPNDKNAGEANINNPLNKQWQALWQGDPKQCGLDSYNDIKAADLQAGVTLNTLLDKQGGIQTAGLNQELSALRGQYGDALTKYGSGSATAPKGTLPAGAQPVAITIAGQTIMVAPTVAQSYLAGDPSDLSALIGAMAIEVNLTVTDDSGKPHRVWRWVDPHLAVLQLQIAQTEAQLGQLDSLHQWLQGAISSDEVHLSEPQLLGVTDPSVDKTLLDDHRQQALDGIYQGQFQNLLANGYGTFKTLSGADLETTVATTLGLNATGNSDAVKKITDEIHGVGGDTPQVSLMPIFYVDAAGGSQQTVLFAVKDKGDNSKTWYVDATGRRFSDLKEFQDNNRQFSENGELVVPANLNMTAGSDGKIALQVVKARNVSAWDRIADPVIGGIATVATIASFTPLAPIAVPIAVTSGLYFAGRAVIKERAYLETGGQWTDTESLMNIGTVAMGVLPEASGGLRFLGMARALNMTRSETLLAAFGVARTTGSISAVGDVGGFGRVWYALPHAQQFGTYLETAGGLNTVAHVTDAAGMLIGAGQTGYSAVNLAEHGGDMSGIDLINSLTNLGIGITGTGLGARSFLNYAGGPRTTSMSFTDAGGLRVNAIVAVDDRPASEDQVYIPSPGDGPVTVAGLVSAGYTHVLVRDPQTNQAVVVPLTSGKGRSTATTSDVTAAPRAESPFATSGAPASLEAMVDPALDGESGIPAAQAAAGLPEVENPSSPLKRTFVAGPDGIEEQLEPWTWTPSENDRTLVVGGGHHFRPPQEGEVFLNINPQARPDILADIRNTPIPDEHLQRVFFERFPATILRKEAPLAESYRVLKPGGSVRITTGEIGVYGGDDRNLIVNALRSVGFENIAVYVENVGENSPSWIWARKPDGVDEEIPTRPVRRRAAAQGGDEEIPTQPARAGAAVAGRSSALLQDTPEGVEAAIEAAHPDYVADIPSAAGLVTKLDDASFKDTVAGLYRARGQNLPDDIGNINAVIVRDPVTDEVTDIFIRQSVASNPQVLAHELYHSKASRGYRTVAQPLLVNLGNRYSNLSEGAADYLAEELNGDTVHTVSTKEALAVRDIVEGWGEGDARVEGIGKETFYRAFFEGNADALRAFEDTASLHPDVIPGENRQPDSVEPKAAPAAGGPATPVAPALASGDRVFPVDLWPTADASIFNGHFQGDATVHLYAVPIDPGQISGPLTFTPDQVAAYATVAPEDVQVEWVDRQTGAQIGQGGRTVNQRFGSLTSGLPAGKNWAIVASTSDWSNVQTRGLSNLDWVLGRDQIPGQSGTAYKPPGVGTHADRPLGDKMHLGIQSQGLGQTVLAGQALYRRLKGYVFRPTDGWVKKDTLRPGDAYYIPTRVIGAIGGKTIPVVDPASGRTLFVDVHNHVGTFVHPVYIHPKPYLDRIDGAEGVTGIANGPVSGIIITLMHIPYLVQRLGKWSPYGDRDVATITQKYAYLDDWKLLSQVENMPPELQARVIPSLTGTENWRLKGYGSDITTGQYIDEILLYFHPDINKPVNAAAYPISGEDTIVAKEVWQLLMGRKDQTRIPFRSDRPGPDAPRDLATIMASYEEYRDAGIVKVTHHDASFMELDRDGGPVARPGDTRYFYKEMALHMAMGPYDLTNLVPHVGHPDFVLSHSDIMNAVNRGGVKRPLPSIVAHFMLGNFTRPSPHHFDLVMAALNHPLLQGEWFNFDSSWLPSIEAQMSEQRAGQPLWVRSSPGARPTFNGAYLDPIKTGRVFYGGDGVNAQTYQQQLAPWFAQQPMLRAIEGETLPGGESLLNNYASAGFMKLYENSKAAIDWRRYRAFNKAGNQEWIGGFSDERRASLVAWARAYEAAHPDVTDPVKFQQFIDRDQVPGQRAPSEVYPAGTKIQPGSRVLRNPEVDKNVRTTFGITASSTVPWTHARLESFRFPDGTPLHPEAIQAGTDAAHIGFTVKLQLATVAATHAVATEQDAVNADLEVTGNKSDLDNRRGIKVAVGTIMAAVGTAPVWMPHALAHLPVQFPLVIDGAVGLRALVNVLSPVNKTINRKFGETAAEEAALSPQALEFLHARYVKIAADLGLDPGRVTGEGSVDDVYRNYLSQIDYVLNTPLDGSNGETNDIRRQLMAPIQGYLATESGRSLGTEQASLEETNPRTKSGQAVAGAAALAYTVGASWAVSSVVADPRLVFDYFLAAGTGISAVYQSVAMISGRHRTAWQELRSFARLQSIFGNAASAIGIAALGLSHFGSVEGFALGAASGLMGEKAWNDLWAKKRIGGIGSTVVSAVAAADFARLLVHNPLALGEAGFAAATAVGVGKLVWAAVRAEFPKIPPQLLNPKKPRDTYPLTFKGIWNRSLPGKPGQPGTGVPRQIAKATVLAGLGLAGVGIFAFFEAYQSYLAKQKTPVTVTSPNGTLAYNGPVAVGTPAGLFPQYASVTLTGDASLDHKGNLWLKVTGTGRDGKPLTAWIDIRALGRIAIAEPTGVDLYSAPSSPQKLGTLTPNSSFTPTGRVQKDALGDVWMEVTAVENGQSLTGWIEAEKTSVAGGSRPSAPASPTPTSQAPTSPVPTASATP
jgi:hypothetical protein